MPYRDSQSASARSIRRKWYEAHREQEIEKAKQSVKQCRERNIALVLDSKSGKPCMDCGVVYPTPVMEFDHREDEEKVASITELARRGASLRRLVEEIAKCDLVCANCHRMRTAIRGGWNMRTSG